MVAYTDWSGPGHLTILEPMDEVTPLWNHVDWDNSKGIFFQSNIRQKMVATQVKTTDAKYDFEKEIPLCMLQEMSIDQAMRPRQLIWL